MISFDIGNGGRFFFGGAEDDVLQSTSGADVMLGGLGADTFTFGSTGGQDRVYGYQPGVDKIQMGASQRTTMLDDTPGGVRIQYGTMGGGGPDSVILVGVKLADLPNTDFAFS